VHVTTPTPTRRRRLKVRLGGVAEISEAHSINRTTISMWDVNNRHGFPKPIARLAMGPVYDLDEVDAWFTARQGTAEA
jgi:eukaryotic-like serine/threonine-protein kinase